MILCILFLFISSIICSNPEANVSTVLFAHGLNGNSNSLRFYQLLGIIHENAHSFNFPDAEHKDITQSDLAQKRDLAALKAAYRNIETREKPILVGVSRGAAAVLNFMALEKPEHIAAIVVESPFGHVHDVVEHLTSRRLQRLPVFLQARILNFLKGGISQVLPHFDDQGAHPIELIHQIDKETPVLFICSKEDSLVPCHSTLRLYQELKNSGHKKVHIFIFEHGNHANLILQEEYREVVHAFYRHYNLPHDPELAEKGKSHFQEAM